MNDDDGMNINISTVGCLVIVLAICGVVLAIAGTAALVRLLSEVGS